MRLLSPRWRKVIRDMWGNKQGNKGTKNEFSLLLLENCEWRMILDRFLSHFGNTISQSGVLSRSFFLIEFQVGNFVNTLQFTIDNSQFYLEFEPIVLSYPDYNLDAYGALLALPLSRILSDQLGLLLLENPLSFTYSIFGLWLVIALVLAFLASYLPARNAFRLTVREVLAYE